MITVTFTERGDTHSLRVEGHAGYADIGQDIICSSASILAYTLASIVDAFGCDVESDILLESGNTTIECKCFDENTTGKVAGAFYYTKRGYMLLAQNYPQYVRLMP